MPLRLFIDRPLTSTDIELELDAATSRHVQVRRLQPNDGLSLFDGRGGEWSAQVLHIGRERVRVRLLAFDAVERELAVPVTLALGVPANERMDALVEKATELGVAAIQPLWCQRAVLRLDGERAERRRVHWQAVAAAASEQSGRTRVPTVMPVRRIAPWLQALDTPAQRLLLSLREDAPAPQDAVDAGRPLLVLSGPEGGLTPEEEAAALGCGFSALRLGERVLRADTAPLALLAWRALQHGGLPAPHAATQNPRTATGGE